jgi:hypothetical protein
VRPLESAYALMVVIPMAVQLVFTVVNLLMESHHHVDHSSELGNLCNQQFVANAFKGFVYLVSSQVVTVEVLQLLMGVIRSRGMVMIGCSMDFTLVHYSSFIHAPNDGQVHSHVYPYVFGWGDPSPIGGGNVEGDIVLSLVEVEAIRGQG